MPSTMIHLLTAYKYNPNAVGAFWIGNLAPDLVEDRKTKDAIHFRDQTDRLGALKKKALTMNLDDEYSQGILLHLYLDYCWDSEPLRNYLLNYTGDHWYRDYRNEIGLAGAWIYHHAQWSHTVFGEIAACSQLVNENSPELLSEDIVLLIDRHWNWHRENNIGPSSSFTPDFVEDFTDRVAEQFKAWLHTL